ncbi:uncharacterized protein LOC119297171 [Triticum dicoccoides]|uniref:uncharacterized protein LOC119297171 n=1 Tax=Triticum dicoccoides TaxID=85692 RepID=UPI00188F5D63|nr:uncharacterized protein LOC119297171 [Triticum dicoccoides]
MCFPPSKSLETTTKKRGKHANSSAGASKSKSLKNTNKKGKGGKSESVRSKRSRTGSKHPEPISIEFPTHGDETNVPVKVRGKSKECTEKIPMVPQDSPAMCTRRKKFNSASPSMSTRSKRRLSL